MRRIADSDLTAEDRATYSRWMRRLVTFYGAVAVLLTGFIVTKIVTNQSTEHATAPAGAIATTRAATVSKPDP
jgi:hypothetical protein